MQHLARRVTSLAVSDRVPISLRSASGETTATFISRRSFYDNDNTPSSEREGLRSGERPCRPSSSGLHTSAGGGAAGERSQRCQCESPLYTPWGHEALSTAHAAPCDSAVLRPPKRFSRHLTSARRRSNWRLLHRRSHFNAVFGQRKKKEETQIKNMRERISATPLPTNGQGKKGSDGSVAYHCVICGGRRPALGSSVVSTPREGERPAPSNAPPPLPPLQVSLSDKLSMAATEVLKLWQSPPPPSSTAGAGQKSKDPAADVDSTPQRLVGFFSRFSGILRVVALSKSSSSSSADTSSTGSAQKQGALTPTTGEMWRATRRFGKELSAQVHRSHLTAASPLYLLSTAVKWTLKGGKKAVEQRGAGGDHHHTHAPEASRTTSPTSETLNRFRPGVSDSDSRGSQQPIKDKMSAAARRRRAAPRRLDGALKAREGSQGWQRRKGRHTQAFPTYCSAIFYAAAALPYAFGIYGRAYEYGLLNSLRQCVLLFTHPSYQKINYTRSGEQRSSLERMLCATGRDAGQTAREIAQCHYHTSIVRGPESASDGIVCRSSYALCVDHRQKQVVLSFRGTSTLSDAIGCVRDGYARVALLHSCGAAASPQSGIVTRVPLGFYEMASSCVDDIIKGLGALSPECAGYDLIITGHSLGGIQAALFHLLFCLPTPTRVCKSEDCSALDEWEALPNLYTCGTSPPGVSSSIRSVAFGPAPTIEVDAAVALRRRLRENAALTPSRRDDAAAVERRGSHHFTAFCYGDDIVPRLQSWSVRSFLLHEQQTQQGGEMKKKEAVPESSSASASTLFSNLFPWTRLRRVAASAMRGPPPSDAAQLSIPGDVFFFGHHSSCGTTEPAGISDPKRVIIPVLHGADEESGSGSEIQGDAAAEPRSSLDLLRHHLPNYYIQRVNDELRWCVGRHTARHRHRHRRGRVAWKRLASS